MRILKRILLFPVLVLAMLVPAGASSAADPATVTIRGFTNQITFNNCNGDLILFNYKIIFVTAPAPGDFTQRITMTGSGTSLTDGTKYVFQQTRSFQQTGSDFILSNRFTLVSQGTAPNVFGIGYFNTETGGYRNDIICR
ncbi:hypothetical protein QFZ35_003227 [Arthrobacter ulcerisalmonis]|nr:hypothetical protein [Arthrobacter ulcerisalmonis]MDQ0664729.1 hypothetical protein [Arthrobacter ulcerisalmonis]